MDGPAQPLDERSKAGFALSAVYCWRAIFTFTLDQEPLLPPHHSSMMGIETHNTPFTFLMSHTLFQTKHTSEPLGQRVDFGGPDQESSIAAATEASRILCVLPCLSSGAGLSCLWFVIWGLLKETGLNIKHPNTI